ncbi:acylglycerol kinase family protein [Porphyrobacter sp. GA68]|uniref:acylglycerol kinase family protein n=1 Tax=Porphyrobacter sp. GA68 TaxID=2883480 RepID=UPI001D18F2A6|nr:acylglycerol kinase family protein [Porphyrobacter sp. GA68]
MTATARTTWLVTNRASGSNDPATGDALRSAFEQRGWTVDRVMCFPDDRAPTPAQMQAAGNPLVSIFTGDGTANTVATALEGWEGDVLVLPGGTQNLLAKRMHGEAEAEEIVDRVARGAMRPTRINGIACEAGKALVDLLVGPGSSWHTVREALREGDAAAVAAQAGEAIGRTTRGAGVVCVDPPLGAGQSFPLLKLTPSHRGIQLDAYHADNLTEFLAQGWALLRRDFRKGPHDRLGLLDSLTVRVEDGSAVDILMDGEPRTLTEKPQFTLAEWNLNLIASAHGY